MQYSIDINNSRLDTIETLIGVTPILKIMEGSKPVSCSDPEVGQTVLATIDLPNDWMLPASNGVKEKSGTWNDLSADASGTASYFRIFDTAGDCKMQGTVGTNIGVDLSVDSVQFTAGQTFVINNFKIISGNR